MAVPKLPRPEDTGVPKLPRPEERLGAQESEWGLGGGLGGLGQEKDMGRDTGNLNQV